MILLKLFVIQQIFKLRFHVCSNFPFCNIGNRIVPRSARVFANLHWKELFLVFFWSRKNDESACRFRDKISLLISRFWDRSSYFCRNYSSNSKKFRQRPRSGRDPISKEWNGAWMGVNSPTLSKRENSPQRNFFPNPSHTKAPIFLK